MAGKTFYPIFADWRSRPGRSEGWRESKRDNFPSEDVFAREYPEQPADLFKAADELVFSHQSILLAQMGAWGETSPQDGHSYIKYWDIGRMQDASVCCVFDITAAPYQLVHYRRVVRKPYPVIQANIEDVHRMYRGQTYIEDNGAGLPVLENLNVPASGNTVGAASKIKQILALKIGMERGYVKFLDKQLIMELSGYMWDDKGLVQDSVMAASGAVDKAGVPAQYTQAIGQLAVGTVDSRVGPVTTSTGRSSRALSLPGSLRGSKYASMGDDEGQRAGDYVR